MSIFLHDIDSTAFVQHVIHVVQSTIARDYGRESKLKRRYIGKRVRSSWETASLENAAQLQPKPMRLGAISPRVGRSRLPRCATPARQSTYQGEF